MPNKSNKRKSWGGFIILSIAVIMVVASFGVYSFYKNYNESAGAEGSEYVTVVIEKGSSTQAIANKLQAYGIIDNALTFRLKSKLNKLDGTYQAGTFELSASMPMEDIIYALTHAVRRTKTFTIPEGYTIRQVAAKLAEDGLISSAEDFYAACEEDYDFWFVPAEATQADPTGTVSAKANRLEGFLMPNTYEIYEDATARDIIIKMLQGFEAVFTDEYKAKADAMGYSVYEIVTIASMVEKETKAAEERPLVAAVIYNRLKINMKIEFCSTVLYSLGEWKSRLYYSDLDVDSPYNTYLYAGLPAGPIASPGASCIQAALNPADCNYLYFVLKEEGGSTHNFAEKQSDFLNYKQDYLNTLNK